MKSSEQIDKLIAEQSAEWTEILKHGNANDLAEFAKWSLKSPQHMRHFMMMTALDRELQLIDPERKLATPALSEGDFSAVRPLRTQPAEQQAAHPRTYRRWTMAAGLAAVIAVSTALYFTTALNGWKEFTTKKGEQRTVELMDGSIVHLNTQSKIKAHFTKDGRDIRLVSGEALFKVAKDAARPFRVHAADIVIQAVGTQFNVYAQPDGTKVSVLEGRVKISTQEPASLGAGEEVKIDDRGRIKSHDTAEVTALAAWRHRRLVFDQRPLSEVVTEFNRYNRTPQFRVIDPAIAALPYSGAFDADDPESLIQLLRVTPDVELITSGTETLIRKRVN